MQFFTKKDEDILNDSKDTIICDCGFCSNEYDYSKSKFEKLKAIFNKFCNGIFSGRAYA